MFSFPPFTAIGAAFLQDRLQGGKTEDATNGPSVAHYGGYRKSTGTTELCHPNGGLVLVRDGVDWPLPPTPCRRDLIRTRTSTRPPPFPASAPCPYRTGAASVPIILLF